MACNPTGRFKDSSPTQLSKAPSPIEVRETGNSTEVSFFKPKNSYEPTEVFQSLMTTFSILSYSDAHGAVVKLSSVYV